LTELDAVFVYPVYSAGTLVVLTVIGVLAFREILSRKVDFDLGGSFCGSRYNQQNRKLENYLLMHAAATWHLTENLDASFRIDNLLNEAYQECATWGAYGTVYNTCGRTYSAKVTWKF
ncbi:MAG: TonB-dependent receptor, partial [Victivallales bacterium]|nr:TonB-dependent receptor [Victivallales bacterium]